MNNWNAIREHYRRFTPLIMAERRNEWAIDPYEWDNGMVRMTPIEYALWHDIRHENVVLYPQYPIGSVFVDFANPVAKVAIECDGREYHQDPEKDARRDKVLMAAGWSVYRITGQDCKTDSDEETREPGRARLFVREIWERHGIRRGT